MSQGQFQSCIDYKLEPFLQAFANFGYKFGQIKKPTD